MKATSEGHRQQLLDGLRRFVVSARQIAGVRRIAVLGSILTMKPDPKDIDVLVVVADYADLTPLAACARRLQGHAQSFNRGADARNKRRGSGPDLLDNREKRFNVDFHGQAPGISDWTMA